MLNSFLYFCSQQQLRYFIVMSSKIPVDVFKQLRIYRRLSFPLVINQMICNRVMKVSPLVAVAPNIYRGACKILGRNFVNHIIQNTYCKIFTAGNTIEQADHVSHYFRNQGIPVILDYCAEGDITSPDLEGNLDQNADLFAASADCISKQKNQMISIKITGLLDMRVLKKLNQAVQRRDSLFLGVSQKKINYSMLLERLQNKFKGVNEKHVQQYVRKIIGYSGDLKQFSLSEVQYQTYHHPYYFIDEQKNNNEVIRRFFTPTQQQSSKLKSFSRRVQNICGPHLKNQLNFRILVDAEQSYVQKGIESISQQLQQIYNKERVYIIPTIQNYLKRSVERTRFEIAFCKLKNLKFAAKLVRGAYIVEQTRLSQKYGYQNPIVDFFTKTTDNYLISFETILQNYSQGEVIVASHNFDTISSAIQIKSKYPNPPRVSFAQLLGLADHLTCKLNNQGHTVYKYLPWAQTQVMIPYMIRRAQQLNQMKYPLDIQFTLLLHELKARMNS